MGSGSGHSLVNWRTFAVASAGIAVLAAPVGYWLGSSRHDAFETVGTAHSTEAQIGLEGDDWSYNIPLDVQWTDASGSWHDDGRPECLPPSSKALENIRITAVSVEARGMGFRQVVAVHCD